MKATDFFNTITNMAFIFGSGVAFLASIAMFNSYWPNHGLSDLEFLCCFELFALALVLALIFVIGILSGRKKPNKITAEDIFDIVGIKKELSELAIDYYKKQRELEETKKKLFALQGNYAQLKRKLETNVSGDEKIPTIIITPTEGK